MGAKTPNDHRSINLNPKDPGGAKNLAHNATQGPKPTPPATPPATPQTPPVPPKSTK